MSSDLPILYSFRRCPYAIRARMTLAYANITYEHREVVLKNKPASLLHYSSQGTVPVLIIVDPQKIIDESRDVMSWAIEQHDPENWAGDFHQDTYQQLIDENDNNFKYYLDRYKYFDRYPEDSQEFYRDKAEVFLNKLNQLLEKQSAKNTSNNFLLGETISAIDVAIFPFVRQFAFVDKPWFDQTQYTFLKQWLETLLQSSLFLSVMQKHSPWVDPV